MDAVIIHLIDGVLMLALMALMYLIIRLIMNSEPFAQWLSTKVQTAAPKKESQRKLRPARKADK